MAGNFDYDWARKQREGILLVSAGNAIRANRDGLPDWDTEGKLRRRENRRQARDVFETQGFLPGLRYVLTGKEYRENRRRTLLIVLPTIAVIFAAVFCALRLWIPVSPYRQVGACADITITGRPFSEEKGNTMDLTLKNKGTDVYDFDGGFVMERKIAGIWRTLPVQGAQTAETAYSLAGESVAVRYDWTEKYGALEAGDYRLVLEAADRQTREVFPMAFEFTVFYLNKR